VSDDYLSTRQVCDKLTAAGADPVMTSRVFSARLQPQNLDNPDKVFAMAVPASGGQVLLVTYRFGLGRPLTRSSPLDEAGEDWTPRWLGVAGPFPADDAETRARELTSA
jgi:hypothetical protein